MELAAAKISCRAVQTISNPIHNELCDFNRFVATPVERGQTGVTALSLSAAMCSSGDCITCLDGEFGDDPAVLLRNYSKRQRSRNADKKLSDAIAALAAGS